MLCDLTWNDPVTTYLGVNAWNRFPRQGDTALRRKTRQYKYVTDGNIDAMLRINGEILPLTYPYANRLTT